MCIRDRTGSGPAQRPVDPARVAPSAGVQGVAAIHDASLGNHLAEHRRVGLSKLRPLGQVQHQVGTLDRRQCAVAVAQLRVLHPGLLHGHRVVDRHRGAPALDRGSNIERRASRMSSELGLNAAPSTATFIPPKDPPTSSAARSTMRARRRILIASTSLRNDSAWSTPSSPARAMNARMSLGRHPPPKPRPACRKRPPIRSSYDSALDSAITSALVASQTSAMALMKLIFVARKALAATLTSSAVAKSQLTTGAPAEMAEAYTSRRSPTPPPRPPRRPACPGAWCR